jgi:hypothetical protein
VASLEKTITVGGTNSPFYEVTISDTDPNAEFTSFVFQISTPGANGGLTAANVQAAVQTLADSVVASHPTFIQGPMKKITVYETTL